MFILRTGAPHRKPVCFREKTNKTRERDVLCLRLVHARCFFSLTFGYLTCTRLKIVFTMENKGSFESFFISIPFSFHPYCGLCKEQNQ